MGFTRQETFDIVARGLIKQGKPAAERGQCKYRTFDSETGEICKCAVGQVIPDDLYTPSVEDTALQVPDPANGFNYVTTPLGMMLQTLGHDLALLSRLQRVHDDYLIISKYEPHSSFVEYLARELVSLSEILGLSKSCLDDALASQ